jgi:hypothetical protein
VKRVHYFQRFSKKEDVVTNNTLLYLDRLQHHNARIFQQLLRALVSDDELVVGAVLTEQEASVSGRIADGVIQQRSFHVVLETKLHANFDIAQLTGHLSAFVASTADLQVLLLLGTSEPTHLPETERAVHAFNQRHSKAVILAWSSFADVIKKSRDVIPEHERMLAEVLDDYEDFCDEEGLLSRSEADLLVVGCSRSLDDNLDLRLYYDSRSPQRLAKYIGFYKDKAVQAIGTLQKVVRVDRTAEGELHGDPLTPDERTRVEKAMASAQAHGWDISRGCHFFLAGRVERTLFRKQTKYPLWNRRYFDLREVLGLNPDNALPDLSMLAEELRDKTW